MMGGAHLLEVTERWVVRSRPTAVFKARRQGSLGSSALGLSEWVNGTYMF